MEEDAPLSGAPISSSRPFDAPGWIHAYRIINNDRKLFGEPIWPFNKGTVAVAEIDGRIMFGVNSDGGGYEDRDEREALAMRDKLDSAFPGLISRENAGYSPADSLSHAESSILMRAARENGGTLAGKTIEVHTDRIMCLYSCPRLLPKLGLMLGNPTVIFKDTVTGSVRTMRDGRWD